MNAFGEMAEWSKAAASKAVIPITLGSGVRIPLSPPVYAYPGLPAWHATPGTAGILPSLNKVCLKKT